MLEHAQRIGNELGQAWRLYQRAGEATGFEAVSVHLVTYYSLGHELPERALRALLREAWRVLAPGGEILFGDVIPYLAQDPLAQAWADHEARTGGEPYWREYCSLDLALCANEAGFERARYFQAKTPRRFPFTACLQGRGQRRNGGQMNELGTGGQHERWVLAMLALARELWVMRDRQRVLEQLLAERGVLPRVRDQWQPDDSQQAAIDAECRRFVQLLVAEIDPKGVAAAMRARAQRLPLRARSAPPLVAGVLLASRRPWSTRLPSRSGGGAGGAAAAAGLPRWAAPLVAAVLLAQSPPLKYPPSQSTRGGAAVRSSATAPCAPQVRTATASGDSKSAAPTRCAAGVGRRRATPTWKHRCTRRSVTS